MFLPGTTAGWEDASEDGKASAWLQALFAFWVALLLVPTLTTASLANAWESPRWQLAVVGAWTVSCLWALLPRKLFLATSYPLLLAGIAVIAADVLHKVNALELLSVWYTFRSEEVLDAVRPYFGHAAVAFALSFLLLAFLWRGAPRKRRGRGIQAVIVLLGLVLALLLPARSWRDAWPAALAIAMLEGQVGDIGIQVPDRANARVSPRNRFDSWQATRESSPSEPETYVLVIGESVRSDRIPGCGGRSQVRGAPTGSILYCDVLAGSSSTHISVPLLITRQLPGSQARVSPEGTLLKAFEAVGFETFWLAVQERTIAWPDAQNQVFDPVPRRDRDTLLPLLEAALARPSARKLIVLHAYNAHAPYSERYEPAHAPFPVGVRTNPGQPSASEIDRWWDDYDNAIDESMGLLDEIVLRLQAQPGMAFFMFTSDHGENMLDDRRRLVFHALKVPTLWDTMVPGIVWANAAWRESNPGKWQMLSTNRSAGLMHMDFAPTLLGAAGIRYAERRTEPVDFSSRRVPARTRFTHLRHGETMTYEQLRHQAR